MNCAKNINTKRIATPIQEHTDVVKWANTDGVYDNCDGIATNLKYNLILSLSVADCTPVALFDFKLGNYALVHSGWRGTHLKISNNAIDLLLCHGSNVSDITVYLGPSISQKNYEVDFDVAGLFSKDCYMLTTNGKYLLDIKSQLKNDMIDFGIKSKNIFSSERCTYEDINLCSYRRDGSDAGRMIFFMGIYDS